MVVPIMRLTDARWVFAPLDFKPGVNDERNMMRSVVSSGRRKKKRKRGT
jgi:hypothetical protein